MNDIVYFMIICIGLGWRLIFTGVDMRQRRVGMINCILLDGGLCLAKTDMQQRRVFHDKSCF